MRKHFGRDFMHLYVIFLCNWVLSNAMSIIFVQQNILKWISLVWSLILVLLGFFMIILRKVQGKRNTKQKNVNFRR